MARVVHFEIHATEPGTIAVGNLLGLLESDPSAA